MGNESAALMLLLDCLEVETAAYLPADISIVQDFKCLKYHGQMYEKGRFFRVNSSSLQTLVPGGMASFSLLRACLEHGVVLSHSKTSISHCLTTCVGGAILVSCNRRAGRSGRLWHTFPIGGATGGGLDLSGCHDAGGRVQRRAR
jgi:hypothetical protein